MSLGPWPIQARLQGRNLIPGIRGVMYLAPCWTTTVRGYAVIPVFGLTCASLIAQGANECIGNNHAQSHSEGKNITYLDFHAFLLN
jgi:hypothetical protein